MCVPIYSQVFLVSIDSLHICDCYRHFISHWRFLGETFADQFSPVAKNPVQSNTTIASPVQIQHIPGKSSPVGPEKVVILIKDKLLSVQPYWAC